MGHKRRDRERLEQLLAAYRGKIEKIPFGKGMTNDPKAVGETLRDPFGRGRRGNRKDGRD